MRIKRSQVVDLHVRYKRQVAGAYLAARTWLRDNLSINGMMARHGILLLTFSLILFGVKQTSEIRMLPFVPPPPAYFSTALRLALIVISFIAVVVISWTWQRYKLADFSKGWLKAIFIVLVLLLLLFILWLTPAIPVLLSTVLGIMALPISLVFMAAVFCKLLACKLDNFLKDRLQSTYWLIFLVVYSVGWLNGMSIIADTCVFKLVFELASWIGLLWFFVIAIIYWKASWQRKSQLTSSK